MLTEIRILPQPFQKKCWQGPEYYLSLSEIRVDRDQNTTAALSDVCRQRPEYYHSPFRLCTCIQRPEYYRSPFINTCWQRPEYNCSRIRKDYKAITPRSEMLSERNTEYLKIKEQNNQKPIQKIGQEFADYNGSAVRNPVDIRCVLTVSSKQFFSNVLTLSIH